MKRLKIKISIKLVQSKKDYNKDVEWYAMNDRSCTNCIHYDGKRTSFCRGCLELGAYKRYFHRYHDLETFF
jgi:hypothetical protein